MWDELPTSLQASNLRCFKESWVEGRLPQTAILRKEHDEHLHARLGRDLSSTGGPFSIHQSSSEHMQHKISCAKNFPKFPSGSPPSLSLTHQVHLARSSGSPPRSDISCHEVPLSRELVQMRWQRPVNRPKKPETQHICSEGRCSESPQPELMPRGECHQALGASCPCKQ